MKDRRLFAAGSYSSRGGPGIRVFSLQNERLEPLYDVDAPDPLWLTLSEDRRHLYAACGGEGPEEGFIRSYTPVDGFEHGMRLEAEQPAHGVCPCHLALCGGDLISANYASGSVSVFPLRDGVPQPMAQQFRHVGRSVDKRRQAGPHVHQVLPLDVDAFLAQDLGLDRLIHYRKAGNTWEKVREYPVPAGAGPRHAVVFGNMLYLATELSSRLLVYRMEGYALSLLQAWELPGWPVDTLNYPAAIRLSPEGKTLAVSCRGADAVAFFSVGPDGLLDPEECLPIPGCWPRDIHLLDSRTTLCASQKSGDVTLLRRQNGTFEALSALPMPGAVAIVEIGGKDGEKR
ncbi:MAG: beta-propeller fold lactonase family protein [Clostridia bacterium]|nr:beta-propeller fold lactonase family protein [Clostridia bacterium]